MTQNQLATEIFNLGIPNFTLKVDSSESFSNGVSISESYCCTIFEDADDDTEFHQLKFFKVIGDYCPTQPEARASALKMLKIELEKREIARLRFLEQKQSSAEK